MVKRREMKSGELSEMQEKTITMMAFFENVIDLAHRMKAVATRVHEEEGFHAGTRAVLRMIDGMGPMTVPQLAKEKSVTRQFIQKLVNPLTEEGFLEARENPNHKRSPLIALTEEGQKRIDWINRTDKKVLSGIEFSTSTEEIHQATNVIARMNDDMNSEAWEEALRRLMRMMKQDMEEMD